MINPTPNITRRDIKVDELARELYEASLKPFNVKPIEWHILAESYKDTWRSVADRAIEVVVKELGID